MRKQTKLVAVLSAAALLAVGASMTSYAASGWVDENGTWVFYDKDGYRVTDTWKKSVNNWFYLDEDGEMAIDMLIEDDDNYYYVDENGAMVTNQWRAIPNEDAGDDDEPENWWYYFQNNGKAYKASTSANSASFKTINGKKYCFDDEGKMMYGWVDEDGERQTGDEDWQDGVYYCGDENDGAQSQGWREIHLLDNDWDPDNEVNGDSFDEDQDRWFFFKSNGKRYTEDDGDKTINGRKYRFDQYGRMINEWYTKSTPTKTVGTMSKLAESVDSNGDKIGTVSLGDQGSKTYTNTWKYYGTPEDGARVTKGWFQVVPSEFLNESDWNDDEDAWYYSDGDGYLYANEFKTINGKKYAFDSYGRMLDGLKLIDLDPNDKNKIYEIYNSDTYDTEEKFEDIYNTLVGGWRVGTTTGQQSNVYAFYFGDENDGAMKVGKQTINLDGDDLSFNFEKSGSKKGRGKSGEDDDKVYLAGKQFKADSDAKYEVVVITNDGVGYSFELLDLMDQLDLIQGTTFETKKDEYDWYSNKVDGDFKTKLNEKLFGGHDVVKNYYVVNTAGSVIKNKTRCKNGDDMFIVVDNYKIERIYEED